MSEDIKKLDILINKLEIEELIDRLFKYKNEDKEMKYQPKDILTIEDVWLILDYIINLQQENKQLTRDKNIMQKYLQLIIYIGHDYDGYNDVENLKAVIDELCKYALYGKKLDDKSIISSSCEQYYNILGEPIEDKEQEEYTLTPDENGTTQINGEWYRVDKK